MLRRITAAALLALTVTAGFGLATSTARHVDTATGGDACGPDIPVDACVPPGPAPGPWEWDSRPPPPGKGI